MRDGFGTFFALSQSPVPCLTNIPPPLDDEQIDYIEPKWCFCHHGLVRNTLHGVIHFSMAMTALSARLRFPPALVDRIPTVNFRQYICVKHRVRY